jgi:hypothetical protein
MKKPEAMSLSIGVLGAVDTYLTAKVILVPVWVTFIAWASFFVLGGGRRGLARSIACNFTGIAIASATLWAIALSNAGAALAAVFVGIGSAAMVQASKVPVLSTTPAVVFGFASTVGTTVATGMPITSLGVNNPTLVAAAAMVLGGCFGLASEVIGNALEKGKSSQAVREAPGAT